MNKEKKDELVEKIKKFHKDYSEENDSNGINESNFLDVFIVLADILKNNDDYMFYVPVEDIKNQKYKEHSGFKIYESDDKLEYRIRVLNNENEVFYPAFDSLDDLKRGDKTSAIHIAAKTFLGMVHKDERMNGIVLNPWSNHFFLYQDTIQLLLERIQKDEPEEDKK